LTNVKIQKIKDSFSSPELEDHGIRFTSLNRVGSFLFNQSSFQINLKKHIQKNHMIVLSIRGVQGPEYRSRHRQKLAFSNRSRTKSGYFWLEQNPE